MTSPQHPRPDRSAEPGTAEPPRPPAGESTDEQLARDPKNPFNRFASRPGAQGLYRPDQELSLIHI